MPPRNTRARRRCVDTISARNHVHHCRLTTLADIDAEFRAWLREAYAVAEQKHLDTGGV